MRKLLTFISKYWPAFTLILLGSITYLSLRPLPRLPDVPGGDKLLHFIAYAGVMFIPGLRRPAIGISAALVLALWSGAIELIQPYVNRYGEWADMAANVLGIICGFALGQVFRALFIRERRKN